MGVPFQKQFMLERLSNSLTIFFFLLANAIEIE